MRIVRENEGIPAPIMVLLLIVFTCATPGIAQASSIDIQTLTEVMIENEMVEALDLGLDFGADPSSPIRFTSTVDVSIGQYSFATLPASTYQGMALTITGAGTFDPTTNVVSTSQFTALGSATFTGTGTDTLNLSASPITDTLQINWAPNRQTGAPKKIKYNNSEEDNIYFPDGDSRSLGFLTLDWKVVALDHDDFDYWDFQTGEWTSFDDDPEFEIRLNSFGFSSSTGGAGTFTTILTPTPEPGSLMLLSLGCLCLLAFVGTRKRGRSSITCA